MWLSRYDICAVARYEHVRATLLDWRTFSSARGVGIEDFAKEAPWRAKSIVPGDRSAAARSHAPRFDEGTLGRGDVETASAL